MTQPAISVVIVVFNGERYLRQAIESALDQTCPPHEIVVIDDGSTDSSAAIANSFGNKVICKAQQNQGPSAARNFGTEVSSGEWIAYLDADDYWLPTKLEQQIAVTQRQPSVDLIYTGRTHLYEDGRSTVVFAKDPRWNKRRLRFRNPMFPTTVLVRRSVALQHPWDVSLRSSVDWWFFYELSKVAEFAVVPDSTAFYRIHSESLTHRDWRSVLHYAQRVAAKIQEDFSGFERWMLKRRVDCRLFSSAAISARTQESRESLPLITRSIVSWPFPDVWPSRYKLLLAMLYRSLRS
ncbi:MAG TPA: glycosyltransferase [Acidobacteriaceae bacterium]